ncbi:hypothetical protein MIT9_P2058 [Methylomarinovum caldicuralii]|uniref:DUF1499 domain-containing protein n=1 Tax=Methylomarinovum caldicuralii TaxID=438856 RepID=A0AAU9C267_9GAMM|nr:DUF1499 domain-containing protein [Methylomarinovum caldicuralii]BCX82472.1 hypothetical protein MIT9_P2058 [Methylomarinovum caldicuralii]
MLENPENWLTLGVAALGLVFAGLLALARLASASPDLAPADGKLPPCPSSPNCVSSQADPRDETHYLPPLRFQGDPGAAWQRLEAIVARQPRVTVRSRRPGYLHAEFRSKIFGFVDDVQFLPDPERRLIHFRSASRAGYSDLGVNRRRIAAIRAAFQEAAP